MIENSVAYQGIRPSISTHLVGSCHETPMESGMEGDTGCCVVDARPSLRRGVSNSPKRRK